MKNKFILAILVAGMIITVIGALFKITHTEFGGIKGNSILAVGLVTEAIAGILFVTKLISGNKSDEFLNK